MKAGLDWRMIKAYKTGSDDDDDDDDGRIVLKFIKESLPQENAYFK